MLCFWFQKMQVAVVLVFSCWGSFEREMLGELFLALFLTFILLLGETHVGLTTLCGIHFQSVVPT